MPRDRTALARRLAEPAAARRVGLLLVVLLAAGPAGAAVERAALNPGLGPLPPEVHRDSPAAAWSSLLELGAGGRFDVAAHLLDLGEVPAAQQRVTGALVAERLYRVLERLEARRDAVTVEAPEGPRVEGGHVDSVLALRFSRSGLRGEVRLRLVEARDRGERAWLFDAQTVSAASFWFPVLVMGVPAQKADPINAGLGPAPPEVRRGSPRETLSGFLTACEAGAFDTAAHYLDLSGSPRERQAEEGPRLARRLMIGLLSGTRLEPEKVSDDPLGVPEASLPDNEERIVTVRRGFRTVDVQLVHRWDAVQGHVWLFSRETLARVGDLYLSRTALSIVDRVPAPLFTMSLAGVQLWQWLSILVALAVGWFVSRLAGPLLRRLSARVVRRLAEKWSGVVSTTLDAPLGFLVWVVLLALVSPFFGLFPDAQAVMRRLLEVAVLLGAGWLASRLTDGLLEHLRSAAAAGGNAVGVGFLPIFSRFVKVFLALIVALGVFGLIGVDVAAGLAGLGLAGAAVAFAAQKTLENVFGATVIATDQPFKVGDFVAIGTDQGTVEEVGLRSTRIRTLGRTVVAIPNGLVAAGRVENFAERDRFLYNPTIGLIYGTGAAQLREVLEGLKELLARHPAVHPEGQRVRFRALGESALQVEILAWVVAPDLTESLRVAEELNFGVLEVVERCGSGFAFPSRTVYLAGDDRASAGAAAAGPVGRARAADQTPPR